MRTAKQPVPVFLLAAALAAAAVAAPASISQDPEYLNAKLIEAVRDGDPARMLLMLNRGANPNAKDSEGTPAVMLAALYSNAPIVQLLLDRGANPNATNAAQANALHWSAGDPAKVRALVLKGANVNARSAPGRTPLLIAAAQDGNYEIVKLLVEKGADVNARDGLEGFLFTGGGGDTPLIEAAKTRDLRTVNFLIERGADVNAAGKTGATALTEAAFRGSADIVRVLIERGADVNHAVNKIGYTPLIFAAMRGSTEVIDVLLAKGAKLDLKDATGATALMWAAYSDRAATAPVARLLAAGADVNVKNKFGETALTWAARRGATPVVALLRNAGASSSEAPASVAEAAPRTTAATTADFKNAVAKSLAVLDKGGPQFVKVSGCISCHNQTLPLMAAQLARKHQVAVPNSDIEAQQVKAILANIKPATEIIAENTDILPDLPVTGPYILMALAAQGHAPDATTAAAAHNIAARQLKDGSWFGWAPRPPLESGDIQATALGIRALQLYGPTGRRAEFDTRIAHAREWLSRAVAVTTEEKVMRLFGLAWSHANRDEIAAAAATLLADQRADGGWGQLTTLASDAYATGKVMVALQEAAKISAYSEPYRRGAEFLLRTQKEDGSWLVKSRAFPFQPLKDSGFPHGRDQWISSAATSWAAMALTYAAEPIQIARRLH